jgi:hypothetical protein
VVSEVEEGEMLGAITTGNATLIAVDGEPILATDPWMGDLDEAYFGSWCLTHEIPEREKRLIENAKYHWYSHGHPDHLNPHSVSRFTANHVLLPDHVGGRIKEGLEQSGHRVTVLPERTWVSLSERVKVLCISDYIQDSILLVDVNGRLFVDMNDSSGRGCKRFIQRITRTYKESYLLHISGSGGLGDADMTNIFDESGQRIPFRGYNETLPTGAVLSHEAQVYGTNHVIPFSSFHQFQRDDSIWAQAHVPSADDFAKGFDHRVAEYIPPFVFVDCHSGEITPTNPKRLDVVVKAPEAFGDNWSDELERDDKRLISEYFLPKELLHRYFEFIRFKVGGSIHTVAFGGPKGQGITFEVPRNSLMTAIRHEIFDDLLIGNFMKTTLHNVSSLYAPNFNLAVAKYADNGRAQSAKDVRSYLWTYLLRSKGEYLIDLVEKNTVQFFRNYVNQDGRAYRHLRGAYRKYVK